MGLNLRQPVSDNAIHRPGHQPFKHSIEEVLNERARRSVQDAWLRNDLEKLRERRHSGR